MSSATTQLLSTRIIDKALKASTLCDAIEVQELIKEAVGGEYQRPIGDRWNNRGMVSGTGGSYDHKLIENVTNMQDAVLERAVRNRYPVSSDVPFVSPNEAAESILCRDNASELVTVEFRESDAPTRTSKKITAVFRDVGCGMRPNQIPRTIFRVGTSHKVETAWVQGSFGMGGLATYGNARAVILVTRVPPELLAPGEADTISVAVVLWQTHGSSTSAYYLVDKDWTEYSDSGVPYNASAEVYPSFEPGTHLALISYGVEGYHRAYSGGDERGFEAILNTRLFDPVLPVGFRNTILEGRRDRRDVLRGLSRRLADNPREDRAEGEEVFPFTYQGRTFHLPVRFWLFCKKGDAGERRNFVAHNHCVLFTSNGQVHKHWTPSDFKSKCKLSKLADRLFVVVQTDELPLEARNAIFTFDRSTFVGNETALQLEDGIAAFIDDWEELREINGQLIKEAITSRQDSRPTLNIARQISRALTMKGFSVAGPGKTSGETVTRPGGRRRKIDLLPDPTTLEGPESVVAPEGHTRFISYVVNAVDDFIPKRGRLSLSCSHPEINDREITVGYLRNGRIRVSIAVPVNAEHGTFQLRAELAGWLRLTGGVGPTMSWTTEFEVSEEVKPRIDGRPGKNDAKKGNREGNLVALQFKSHEEQDGWTKETVGDVEMVPAEDLAAQISEYSDLSVLGETRIPTLVLNSEYVALKRYLNAGAKNVVEETIQSRRDRYAVGVGVGLCMLFKEQEKRAKSGEIDDSWCEASKQAIARSVLSMMPAFDELAKESGLNSL